MGRIITIASQKGGVGKTTLSLNLAFNLSRLGSSVLIVDADPQGGITLATNLKKRTEMGLIHALREECSPQSLIMKTKSPGLAVAGIGAMDPDDVFMLENFARNGKLKQLLATLAKDFDYMIVDAPAGTGSIVAALLTASGSVLLANTCRMLSLKSVSASLKLVRWARDKGNTDLVIEGIILSMVNLDNEIEAQLYNEMHQTFPPQSLFQSYIPFDAQIEQATTRALPITLVERDCSASRAFLEVAMELKQREMNRQMEAGNDEIADGLF